MYTYLYTTDSPIDKISINRNYWAVGQGLFTSQNIIAFKEDGQDIHINIVYDCGSISKGSSDILKREIEIFIKSLSYKKVNHLYISHFDKDHVNGIKILKDLLNKESISVENIHIPYLSLGQKMITLIDNKEYVSEEQKNEYHSLVITPYTWFEENFRDSNIHIVFPNPNGSNEQNAEQQDYNSDLIFRDTSLAGEYRKIASARRNQRDNIIYDGSREHLAWWELYSFSLLPSDGGDKGGVSNKFIGNLCDKILSRMRDEGKPKSKKNKSKSKIYNDILQEYEGSFTRDDLYDFLAKNFKKYVDDIIINWEKECRDSYREALIEINITNKNITCINKASILLYTGMPVKIIEYPSRETINIIDYPMVDGYEYVSSHSYHIMGINKYGLTEPASMHGYLHTYPECLSLNECPPMYGFLYTGDAALNDYIDNTGRYLTACKDYLGDRIYKVGSMMVPHHGSKRNWDFKNNPIENFPYVYYYIISADPTVSVKNTGNPASKKFNWSIHGHPDSEVLFSIENSRRKWVLVDSKSRNRFHEHIHFYYTHPELHF